MNKAQTYIVQSGQSWFDVSLKLYGTPLYGLDLATAHQCNITDKISAGTLVNRLDLPTNETILHIYNSHQTNPATGFLGSDLTPLEGIGFWFVQTDFEIG